MAKVDHNELTAKVSQKLRLLEAEAIRISRATLPQKWRQYEKEYKRRLESLEAAHSGSWFGDHSSTYYEGFKRPPPGDSFDVEWGFIRTHTRRRSSQGWQIHSRENLQDFLFKGIGEGIFDASFALAEDLEARLGSLIDQTLDTLTAANKLLGQDFLVRYIRRVEQEISAYSFSEYINSRSTSAPRATRDSSEVMKGSTVPFHVQCYAAINAVAVNQDRASKTTTLIRSAIEMMTLSSGYAGIKAQSGRIFLGHGRSPIWREVKDFLTGRLGLEFEEFNRVPTAGINTQERLGEMIDACGFALLILTSEDIHQDSTEHARENVIHEAGLFQGKLGWRKAIILLEEGCSEFSNIVGLGQIRFPKGRISAVFEDIRAVLEREGILKN